MRIGPDTGAQLVLSALERAVLAAAGRRVGAAGPAWQAQCAAARVLTRSHSGVGFVTRLELPADVPDLPTGLRAPGPVLARHRALPEPAEFLVQVRNGRIATIEAFCYAGTWPADDEGFVVDGPG